MGWKIPALAALLAAAFGAGRQTSILEPGPASQERAASDPLDPRAAAEQVSLAFQAASAEAAQSVVQIRSYRQRRDSWRPHQEGSGVVVSDDGQIVTNHHVVDGGTRFEIVFTDGSKAPAKLLGSDDSVDLALLQLEGPIPSPNGLPLRPMPLRTELPPVGELVLAVGNPLSLGHTVTLGVVNGHGRSNLDIAEYENYIQTDAAINPGNSGGPLVDVQGRAIGITVAVGLESNNDGGLAFAIPASMVRRVIDDIVEHGRVRRAYLGVQTVRSYLVERTLEEDRRSGYDGFSRVKVKDSIANTPAARAGIRAGDIILKLGDNEIRGTQTYFNALIEADPEDTIEITLWRAGRTLTKSVKLAER
ncbi:putative periplasmic serine endoprotease DegP-like precursor [Planctomycetes bacterium Poly30]|uniref:Putative periplasmic serine endoprotease DegP-like n=1 Tax=Saltatorellus ferox TaxID=2528018 RepID=A0A518EX56_9BACT|nr:putative periplasmic serine endoprotease DegP-like precursor [Planctomycetes bacterium Poly30]